MKDATLISSYIRIDKLHLEYLLDLSQIQVSEIAFTDRHSVTLNSIAATPKVWNHAPSCLFR